MLVAAILSACNSTSNAVELEITDSQYETTRQEEALQKTSSSVLPDKYYEAYWEEVKRIQPPPSESVVPDEKVAKGIAEEIFKSLCPDLIERGYVFQKIRYIETDDVWIVTFFPDANNVKTFGGDWNIAIRKKDCEVIRIFIGE